MYNTRPQFDHILIEIFDVPDIKESIELNKKIKDFVDKCGFNIVKDIKYSFPNGGLTYAFILSESHIIFHSWIELNYINISLMSCSPVKNLNKINKMTKDVFKSDNVVVKIYNQ